MTKNDFFKKPCSFNKVFKLDVQKSIMIKKGFFLLLFLITSICYSQKEANIWYFGDKAGLDFNNGTPVVLKDYPGKLLLRMARC